MLLTQLKARPIAHGASESYTDHLVLWRGFTAIEVCGLEKTFNAHFKAQLLKRLPLQGIYEALALLETTGAGLPLTGPRSPWSATF